MDRELTNTEVKRLFEQAFAYAVFKQVERNKEQEERRPKTYEAIDGKGWAYLLSFRPQFKDRCDFSKLTPLDFCILLSNQTQFKDQCDFSKLNGTDWAILLSNKPIFKDICDFSKLDGMDLDFLVYNQPQFKELRDKLENKKSILSFLKQGAQT